jgi:hypothetical protein
MHIVQALSLSAMVHGDPPLCVMYGSLGMLERPFERQLVGADATPARRGSAAMALAKAAALAVS